MPKRAYPGRRTLAHVFQHATGLLPDGTSQTNVNCLIWLEFFRDEPACLTTPSVVFTDSVEKAAESPVKKSKERAKCGLLNSLHNSMGALIQILYSLHLTKVRHILSIRICAVAQAGLQFPHAFLDERWS